MAEVGLMQEMISTFNPWAPWKPEVYTVIDKRGVTKILMRKDWRPVEFAWTTKHNSHVGYRLV